MIMRLATLLGAAALGVAITGGAPHAARLPSRGVANDSVVAARVALLALQASALGTHGPIKQYIMLPNLNPMDESHVLKALSTLWKPAECSAWQDGTLMWVTCWARDQLGDQSIVDSLPMLAKESLDTMHRELNGKTPLKVEVQDPRSRLTVTDAQYEKFLTDYYVVSLASATRLANALSGSDVDVLFQRSGSDNFEFGTPR
jgi:hypothetical protein